MIETSNPKQKKSKWGKLGILGEGAWYRVKAAKKENGRVGSGL
jgi:hypothetical protein